MKRNTVYNKITYDKNILINKDYFMIFIKRIKIIITNYSKCVFEKYIFFNEANIRLKKMKSNSLKEVL